MKTSSSLPTSPAVFSPCRTVTLLLLLAAACLTPAEAESWPRRLTQLTAARAQALRPDNQALITRPTGSPVPPGWTGLPIGGLR